MNRVVAQDVDVGDTGIDVPPNGTVENIVVEMTNHLAELSGRVADAGGAIVRDCFVVVFAQDPVHWTVQTRHLGVARPAGRAVIQSFDSITCHHGSIGIPQDGGVFRHGAEDPLVARFDGLHQRMILGDFRARDGHIGFVLHAVVRMFLAKLQDKLFDGSPHFLERHRWRNANIQEDIGAVGRPADAPRVAAAYATHIHNAGLSVVRRFLFPRYDPGINRV